MEVNISTRLIPSLRKPPDGMGSGTSVIYSPSNISILSPRSDGLGDTWSDSEKEE